MAKTRGRAVTTINPLFKLLIGINLCLCAVCLGVMIALGLVANEPPSELQRQLYSACETVFKMTAGAFIGLLGGKAASADRIREAEPDVTGEGLRRPSAPPPVP